MCNATKKQTRNCNNEQSMYEPTNALNKYDSWQVSNCHMFRHRGAILREGIQIQNVNLDTASP